MKEITITSKNFEEEVLNSDKPVLLDFWASWCGPCKMIAPFVAEFAEEMGDTVKVGKVNVDEEPNLAAEFKIVSIPTIVVIKNGAVTNTSVGFKTKEQLAELLK